MRQPEPFVPSQGEIMRAWKRGMPEDLERIVRYACRYVDQVAAKPRIHAYYERCDERDVVVRGNACNHDEP